MVPDALGAVLARLLPAALPPVGAWRARRAAPRLHPLPHRWHAGSAAIGTSRRSATRPISPSCSRPAETLDPDPGIEALTLEAPETALFVADQAAHGGRLVAEHRAARRERRTGAQRGRGADRADRPPRQSLGADRVVYLAPQRCICPSGRAASFRPWRRRAGLERVARGARAPLPLRLLAAPEPIEMLEPGAGIAAPQAFLWRGRIHRRAHARDPTAASARGGKAMPRRAITGPSTTSRANASGSAASSRPGAGSCTASSRRKSRFGMTAYAELQVTTNFSFLRGARIRGMALQAAALGHRASP